ncbi:hypothetical protein JA9_000100 [Meyerozyma sp. JA9]|nr:hypothetical protein JA9_000100 [Meyerozyma sp. JA9]
MNTTSEQSTPRENTPAGKPESQPNVQHGSKLDHELAEKLGESHLNILPTKKLITVLGVLSLGLLMAMTDQAAVTVALPLIGKDLHAQNTINWAGTASLLANCVSQVLLGRFSDIFGRKSVLISSLIILSIAELCCGFAQTGPQFYVFRAFAGIGGGGVQSMTMVILSDVVTLKQRGRFQGILGAQIGIGNAIGPFLMAAFAEHHSWRDFYYFLAPTNSLVIAAIFFVVKGKKSSAVLTRSQKFKKIDYLGLLFSTAALTLLLIPVSGGGSTYAWDSSLVIVLFIIGGLCMISFILIEWKVPPLPMIPLRLFASPSVSLLLAFHFLYGMAYYAFQYYLPYYFQIVRQDSSLRTAVFLLPLVLTQSCSSTVAGNLISIMGHYKVVVCCGFAIWTLGYGLLCIWTKTTPAGSIVGILIVIGIGAGCIFQPSMVAVQAHARKADRAVVISARNVLRSFGGAVGIAIGSLIVSNSLLKEVNAELKHPRIPVKYLHYLKDHIYGKITITGLSASEVDIVRDMYMSAIKNFFYAIIPMIGVCLVGSLFIKDRGLQCIDEIDTDKNEKH